VKKDEKANDKVVEKVVEETKVDPEVEELKLKLVKIEKE